MGYPSKKCFFTEPFGPILHGSAEAAPVVWNFPETVPEHPQVVSLVFTTICSGLRVTEYSIWNAGNGLVGVIHYLNERSCLLCPQGGADQGMPIIVSRVAPNTPADLCIPRLNEGDQVLFINGRDVSQHTHEQVVMFIRASRETHSGELVLVVRPNGKSE